MTRSTKTKTVVPADPPKNKGGRPRDPNAGEPQSTRLRPATKKKLVAFARRHKVKPALAARWAIEILVGERAAGDFTDDAKAAA